MKIRYLIERLEKIEKEIEVSPHPNIDNIKFNIHFGDAKLDDRDWDVEIEEVFSGCRPCCGCSENAMILIAVEDVTLR